MTRLGRAWIALTLAFLYAPILAMAAMSLNASEFYALPFRFSMEWYARLWRNEAILAAAWRSLWIAALVALLATLLGTMAALALWRHAPPGKRLLQAMLFPPIAVPWLITGTAMLVFFFWIGVGRGAPAVILGHVALALPYVILVVSARLAGFDRSLEEAARALGASPWRATWAVTLPIIAPGVAAGALFAFAVSFDQFVVSYFLARPGDATLPVLIYTAIRKGFTPEINAVSTLVIAASMGLVLLAARNVRFGGR